MSETLQGTVKWFSAQKGLSGGQPVLFEAGTDANGRSLAKNISPADPNAE